MSLPRLRPENPPLSMFAQIAGFILKSDIFPRTRSAKLPMAPLSPGLLFSLALAIHKVSHSVDMKLFRKAEEYFQKKTVTLLFQ